jgi:hypothetical protein
MINNIFKLLFLMISIVLVVILYDISKKMANGRFVPSGSNSVIDTKTGQKYYWEQEEGYQMLNNKGDVVKIESLPNN